MMWLCFGLYTCIMIRYAWLFCMQQVHAVCNNCFDVLMFEQNCVYERWFALTYTQRKSIVQISLIWNIYMHYDHLCILLCQHHERAVSSNYCVWIVKLKCEYETNTTLNIYTKKHQTSKTSIKKHWTYAWWIDDPACMVMLTIMNGTLKYKHT